MTRTKPTPTTSREDDARDADHDHADRRRRRRRRRRPRRRRRRGADGPARSPRSRRPGGVGRGPGGPDDGGPGRAARMGRRIGIAIGIAIVIGIFLLFSVGLDLWTDALWYSSVGFDTVFWTRLTATIGLGVGAFVLALLVLFGNLWLAGRLAPTSVEGGTGGCSRSSIGSTRRRRQPTSVAVRGRPTAAATRSAVPATTRAAPTNGRNTIVLDAGDMPDLSPLAGWVLGGDRAVRRAPHRRFDVRGVGDGPALDPSRPVLADRVRHRPDLQQGHRLLPVRAAVPAPRPGAVQRARHQRAAPDPRPLRRQRLARRPRLLDPDPRPPRGPRRPVPAVGRVRLPARQARARLQQPRRRDRRELHRPERPVHRLRHPDRPVRDRRRAPRRRSVHPRPVAARADHRASGSWPRSSSGGSTRRPSSASRSSRTSTPRKSATSATTSR